MLRTRLLAAATATVLALGFAVGGASPALATPPPPPPVPSGVTVLYDNGVTCNGSGYTKPAALDNLPEGGSGSFTPVAPDNWGTLAWNASTKTVTWTINAGWDVDICVKGGSVWPIAFIDTSAYTGVSYGHPQGLSHLGYRIISRPALEATAAIDLTDPTCESDQSLDEEGFDYTNSSYVIVDDGSEDGTFEVVFTADEGYEFEGGLAEVTFADTLGGPSDGEECVLPITDAFLAFTEPTCLEPEALDEESFEFDSELAELTSVEVDGLDYTVVFTAIGENTQFFQSSEEVEGRVVSEGGTVLTFTGTLDGPNTELCPQIVIPDPVIVDDCLTQSYTISSAEGVRWTRSVDGGDPVPVVFGDGQGSVTFDADPFQKVVITASADEGYTMPEQYGPFEYTFAFDEECLPTAPVTTASVSWTQPDCLGNPGSYRLTNEPGVIWTVDGVVVAGNTAYSAPAGSTPSIVASLEPASEEFPTGFGWSDPGQRTIWNLVFAAAADCLPTLALTGASNALGGLGIAAIVLIMAGTGLVLARRRDEARVQS